MADAPPPADGWTRILFKSKFGAGRDFEVTDTSGARILFVDGKIGATPKAEVRDAQDAVLYTVKGQFLGIPKRMVISAADGSQVAELKAKAFSIVKDKMTMTMADGSSGWPRTRNQSIPIDARKFPTRTAHHPSAPSTS